MRRKYVISLLYLLCSPWRRSNLDETCRSYTELRLVFCDVLCAAVGLHCGMAMNLGSLNYRLLPDHLSGNSSVQLGEAVSFTSSFITYPQFCCLASDAWQRCIPHLEKVCRMTVTVGHNFPRFPSVVLADWTLVTCVAIQWMFFQCSVLAPFLSEGADDDAMWQPKVCLLMAVTHCCALTAWDVQKGTSTATGYIHCCVIVLSLIFAWPCISDINNIDNKLDATVTVY